MLDELKQCRELRLTQPAFIASSRDSSQGSSLMAAFNNTHMSVKVLEPAAEGEEGKFYWGMVSQAGARDLFQLPVNKRTTVNQLKAMIEKEKGIDKSALRVIYCGKELAGSRDMESVGFNHTDDPLLHVIPLPGH